MAIEAYLTEHGQKALELIGWPEWATMGFRERLALSHDEHVAFKITHRADVANIPWQDYRLCPNPIALCILRDWFREKLRMRDYHLAPYNPPHRKSSETALEDQLFELVKWGSESGIHLATRRGLDRALIGSVLEVYSK